MSWLLQLCAGQAEVSLAVDTDTVGFVTVMCVCVSSQPGASSAPALLGAERMTLSLKLALCVASVCQLPPVYLFNCFGCFFPFLLGLCLPGLSAGSP